MLKYQKIKIKLSKDDLIYVKSILLLAENNIILNSDIPKRIYQIANKSTLRDIIAKIAIKLISINLDKKEYKMSISVTEAYCIVSCVDIEYIDKNDQYGRNLISKITRELIESINNI